MEKMDCVGHVQKQMETAPCNLKMQYRGQKMADGKYIGLTDKVINSLQNYYGDAICSNKGNVQRKLKVLSLGASGRWQTPPARSMITKTLCQMPLYGYSVRFILGLDVSHFWTNDTLKTLSKRCTLLCRSFAQKNSSWARLG